MKVPYTDALELTEEFLNHLLLSDADRGHGYTVSIYDYHDGNADNLKKRPWTGVRVAEVDVHNPNGGASWMQTDTPWGIAVCGQAERAILSLVEDWDRDVTGEIQAEFWRLGAAASGAEWGRTSTKKQQKVNASFEKKWDELLEAGQVPGEPYEENQ